MGDPVKAVVDEIVKPSTIRELMIGFLQREKIATVEEYDDLTLRMMAWGNERTEAAAINEFSPIMLIEQCRREFDMDVNFVLFALVAADLQWGPRLIKVAQFDNPVWIMALKGFPAMIEESRKVIESRG